MKIKRFISVFLLCACLTGLFLTPAAGALEVTGHPGQGRAAGGREHRRRGLCQKHP